VNADGAPDEPPGGSGDDGLGGLQGTCFGRRESDSNRARIAAVRPIAGAAPGPLDGLRRRAEQLQGIVRQWRRPDNVTVPTMESAESLLLWIYQFLEDQVTANRDMMAVYVHSQRPIRGDYRRAMEMIWTFKRVLAADEAQGPTRTPRQEKAAARALSDTREEMVATVQAFQERLPALVAELERVSKDPW
jgi:hypothetical protein